MTIRQPDGMAEVTPHGPGQKNTLQTVALTGQACAANRKKRRKKPNTRRRPKNGNMARRRAPRVNIDSLTCQRVKGQSHQEESLGDPVLHLVLLQVSIIRQLGRDGGPLCL